MEQAASTVPQTFARIADSHEMNWVNACKGQGEATCPFSYAAPLTEVMLLGLVALRTGQGFKIKYDADNMRVTNSEQANTYLTREYRNGLGIVIDRPLLLGVVLVFLVFSTLGTGAQQAHSSRAQRLDGSFYLMAILLRDGVDTTASSCPLDGL